MFGRLSEYREEKQLKVSSIVPEEDPNAEPLHWLQTVHLKRLVYSQPFTLPPGVTSSSVGDENLVTLVHEVILQYLHKLHDSKKTFTLTGLKSDKELERRCYYAVKDGGCDQLPQVLMSIISDLPTEGTIIPAKLALRTLSGETVYEVSVVVFERKMIVETFLYLILKVFSESKHLFPAILDYINTKMKTPSK